MRSAASQTDWRRWSKGKREESLHLKMRLCAVCVGGEGGREGASVKKGTVGG